jgi:hypothetical protein
MNVEKRLQELERVSDQADSRLTMVVSLVGSKAAVTDGREMGPVYYPVTGYRAHTGGQTWTLKAGETVEALRARAEAEVTRFNGTAMLLETYA